MIQVLRANGKMPFPVKDMAAVQVAADSICSDRITPVFTLSSVTGQGKRVREGETMMEMFRCNCSMFHDCVRIQH